MPIEKVECKICKTLQYGVNAKGVCPDCTYKRNHNGKSSSEVYSERQKSKPIKVSNIKNKFKKPSGEKELFEEIWNERAHYCENKNCRKFLGQEPSIQFFSHRKSKGARPDLRLKKDNIDLLCSSCHHEWEFGDRKKINV